MRLRHTSSGGSSTDLHHPRKNKLSKLSAKQKRTRYDSTKSEDTEIKMKKSEEEEEDECSDENYDEFDLLGEMKEKVPKRTRTISGSGPGYFRSVSECQPQILGAVG